MHVRVWGRGFITVANQSVRAQVWVHEGAYVEISISVVLLIFVYVSALTS